MSLAILAEVARAEKVTVEELQRRFCSQRSQNLFDGARERIKPARDEKVLTAWNGLMLAASPKRAQSSTARTTLKLPDAMRRFVLDNLRRDGLLLQNIQGRAGKAQRLS